MRFTFLFESATNPKIAVRIERMGVKMLSARRLSALLSLTNTYIPKLPKVFIKFFKDFQKNEKKIYNVNLIFVITKCKMQTRMRKKRSTPFILQLIFKNLVCLVIIQNGILLYAEYVWSYLLDAQLFIFSLAYYKLDISFSMWSLLRGQMAKLISRSILERFILVEIIFILVSVSCLCTNACNSRVIKRWLTLLSCNLSALPWGRAGMCF